jgi:subtilisin family serine protease
MRPRPSHIVATSLLVLAAASAPAARAGSDANQPGEILVKLNSSAALQPLLQKYQFSLLGAFGARPIYRLKLPATRTVEATLTQLALEPTVQVAEPNAQHSSPEARRNQPWTIGNAAAYQAQWAPQALRLAQAQTLSTGAGVRVAVLDTGVDLSHPLLAGRMLPGRDFVDGDNLPAEEGSADPVLYPGFGHGTHVAGLVALVAPGARIMPLRVLDAAGQGNAWVLAEALLHAVDPDGNPATDDGAHVVNLSLGSLNRTRLFDTIAQLVSCSAPDPAEPALDISDPGYNADKQRCASFGGALFVAAAGNDGSRSLREYPAAESTYAKLSVAASTADHTLAAFSNSGNWIDLAAPGAGLTSSVPGAAWATWSGTSMAAPLVSGVAALLRANNPALRPVDLMRRIQRNTAPLCGTALRQLDAWSVLTLQAPPAVTCP